MPTPPDADPLPETQLPSADPTRPDRPSAGSPAAPDTAVTTVAPADTADVTADGSGGPAGGAADPLGVPGFTSVRLLGRGGMGAVYLARQHAPGRLVAVKVVLAGAAAAPDVLDRFRLEGEAIARLAHPNIVQVFACGQAGSVPYLVLEYVDGPGLDRVPGPLPPRRAAELVARIAAAVGYAHRHGIVHRDLKPANVLLTAAGEPKVTDFGLAKFDPALAPSLNDLRATTRSGAILGSPRYMAPEQAAGRPDAVGPATDVHALGLILYELLTGRPAFDGGTLLGTLERVRTAEPAAVRAAAPAVPRDLETICAKCLEKDPAKRYPTAGELADDLGRFLDGRPVQARPVPRWERAAKWVRRHPDDAVVRGVICFLLPPTAFAVLSGAPLLGLAGGVNLILGAVAALRLPWWARLAVLLGCAVAAAAEWAVIPGRAVWAYRYFLLGAVCGATGRRAGRAWGVPAVAVTAASLVCGGCALLLVAVPTGLLGAWGVPWTLVLASAAFAAGGIGGGVWYARSASAGRTGNDATAWSAAAGYTREDSNL